MKPGKQDDGFRISEALWARMNRCCPHRNRIRWDATGRECQIGAAMEAILLVLRTGMQWNALDEAGICSCSAAYRRFREWCNAGVFENFSRLGLLEYDDMKGID